MFVWGPGWSTTQSSAAIMTTACQSRTAVIRLALVSNGLSTSGGLAAAAAALSAVYTPRSGGSDGRSADLGTTSVLGFPKVAMA